MDKLNLELLSYIGLGRKTFARVREGIQEEILMGSCRKMCAL